MKNLLVGEDVTYERKIREMIVASRVEGRLQGGHSRTVSERRLSGPGLWGVEMAARNYFGKSAKELTLAEGAMLAGLLKGPNYYSPDRHPDRARERFSYVLGRMLEDGYIDAGQKASAQSVLPVLAMIDRPRRDSGFHFTDFVTREAKTDGVASLTADSCTVHATINAALQRATEAALQEGLAQFEINNGRVHFQGAEANLADTVQKIADGPSVGDMPAWQQALQSVRLPLYDVHWRPAIIVAKGDGKKGGDGIRVGLHDGRVVPLTTWTAAIRRNLGLYDVVYVRVFESKSTAPAKTAAAGKRNGKANAKPAAKPAAPPAAKAVAQLRARPIVQGAALVIENKTGRILAMAGSFSYPLSQLNRTSQTQRQPGSAIKPLTYLAALQQGLQPNTLVLNDEISLPTIGSKMTSRNIIAREYGGGGRDEGYWTPKDADGGGSGIYTLRRGLENSAIT